MTHTYNVVYTYLQKGYAISLFAIMWFELEEIALSQISQLQKDTHHVISFIYKSFQNHHLIESYMVLLWLPKAEGVCGGGAAGRGGREGGGWQEVASWI